MSKYSQKSKAEINKTFKKIQIINQPDHLKLAGYKPARSFETK